MTVEAAGIGPFDVALPRRILFGRGRAAEGTAALLALGHRGVLVHGATPARADWLISSLGQGGATVTCLPCKGEPTLAILDSALKDARAAAPDWVAGIGGGSAIDLAKALAALVPAPGGVMDHLEVVGRGLPLVRPPLPFVAIPTTAGTGAEATRNAVIGLPDHGRKVSLRDLSMLPRLAIVDPALTDHCARAVTLASGLDALVQVIEPLVSSRATPFTDALCRPVIGSGMKALMRLMEGEDAAARDTMAWVSLTGGMALANSGLGAVHGLAGVVGGMTNAAHGAICGALIGPVLALNSARATGDAAARLAGVRAMLAGPLGVDPDAVPQALGAWARDAGLPGLVAQGLDPAQHAAVVTAAQASSSMKGNPLPLEDADLSRALAEAG